eukprot:TRINITY_DN14013_c0_g2_i1.p1 TRINITY_DN14013_c0_g2~~TRINITY_DN14013_c0_g2_i1.p1  ORF type:complete len:369 (-),score=23.33 TRINITY_DN14013_c0_g2_i1:23-1129(-)
MWTSSFAATLHKRRQLASAPSLTHNFQDVDTDINYITCDICTEDIDIRHSFTIHECGHIYCVDCLNQFFICKVAQGVALGMTCPHPHCDCVIQPKDVKNVVHKEHYDKYDHCLLLDHLARDPDVVWCPRPSCSQPTILSSCVPSYGGSGLLSIDHDDDDGGGRGGGAGSHAVVGRCASCLHHWCLRCQEEPHEGQSCETGTKSLVQLHAWFSTNKDFVKRCPNCKVYIEKSSGCNHMSCGSCKFKFCWLCLGPFSDLHYATPGTPCFQKQYYVDKVAERRRRLRLIASAALFRLDLLFLRFLLPLLNKLADGLNFVLYLPIIMVFGLVSLIEDIISSVRHALGCDRGPMLPFNPSQGIVVRVRNRKLL